MCVWLWAAAVGGRCGGLLWGAAVGAAVGAGAAAAAALAGGPRRCCAAAPPASAPPAASRRRLTHTTAHARRYFSPERHEPGYSLAITGGRCGARLTHSHERQYHYVRRGARGGGGGGAGRPVCLPAPPLPARLVHAWQLPGAAHAGSLAPWCALGRSPNPPPPPSAPHLPPPARPAPPRPAPQVLQSLTLWREISTDMFQLWYLAEADMLAEGNGYRCAAGRAGGRGQLGACAGGRRAACGRARGQGRRPASAARTPAPRPAPRRLTDTGQGLNRVQPAPRVSRAMHAILARCQQSLGGWVGSSVIHLGDHNVPNALLFIDKYTQVGLGGGAGGGLGGLCAVGCSG